MKSRSLQSLGEFIQDALPSSLAGKLPSPELIQAWGLAAGEEIARRARPVRLDREGDLVVTVTSSIWQQELSLCAPQLVEKLQKAGLAVTGLKLVRSPAPPPPKPKPEPVELTPQDEAVIEDNLKGVSDPELKRALAGAMRAQLKVGK